MLVWYLVFVLVGGNDYFEEKPHERISDPALSNSNVFQRPNYVTPESLLSGSKRDTTIAQEAKLGVLERIKKAYLLRLLDAEAIARQIDGGNKNGTANATTVGEGNQFEYRYNADPTGERPNVITDVVSAKDTVNAAKTVLAKPDQTDEDISAVRGMLNNIEKFFANILSSESDAGSSILGLVQLSTDDVENTILQHLPWERRIRRMELNPDLLSLKVENFPVKENRLPMTAGFAEFALRFPHVLEFMSVPSEDSRNSSDVGSSLLHTVDHSKIVVDTQNNVAGFRHYDDVALALEHQASMDAVEGRFLVHERWLNDKKTSVDFSRFIKEYGAVFLKNLVKCMTVKFNEAENKHVEAGRAIDLTTGNDVAGDLTTGNDVVGVASSTNLKNTWGLASLIEKLIIQDRNGLTSTNSAPSNREVTVEENGESSNSIAAKLFSHAGETVKLFSGKLSVGIVNDGSRGIADDRQGSPWEDKLWDILREKYASERPESFSDGVEIESSSANAKLDEVAVVSSTSFLQEVELSTTKNGESDKLDAHLLDLIAKKVLDELRESGPARTTAQRNENAVGAASSAATSSGAHRLAKPVSIQSLWQSSVGPCQNSEGFELPCSGNSLADPTSKLSCVSTVSSSLLPCRQQCEDRSECFAVEFLETGTDRQNNCNLRLLENRVSSLVAAEATILAETMRLNVKSSSTSSLAQTGTETTVHCWIKAAPADSNSPLVESHALTAMPLMQQTYVYVHLPKLDLRRHGWSLAQNIRSLADMGKGKQALSDLSHAYEKQHNGKKLWTANDGRHANTGEKPRIIYQTTDGQTPQAPSNDGIYSLAESASRLMHSERTLRQIRMARQEQTSNPTAPTQTPSQSLGVYVGNFILVSELHYRNGTLLQDSITNPTSEDLESAAFEEEQALDLHEELASDMQAGGNLLSLWKPFYGMCLSVDGEQTVAYASESTLTKPACRDHCMRDAKCRGIHYSRNGLCFRINEPFDPAFGSATDAGDGECWIKATQIAQEFNTTTGLLNKIAKEEASTIDSGEASDSGGAWSLVEEMREHTGLQHEKKVEAVRKMVRNPSYMKAVDVAKPLLEEEIAKNETTAPPSTKLVVSYARSA